jgi:hypothetical protein
MWHDASASSKIFGSCGLQLLLKYTWLTVQALFFAVAPVTVKKETQSHKIGVENTRHAMFSESNNAAEYWFTQKNAQRQNPFALKRHFGILRNACLRDAISITNPNLCWAKNYF